MRRILPIVLVLFLLFGCLGPQAPTNVQAKQAYYGIDVTWTPSPSSNVAGYNVYRSTVVGDLGTKVNAALVQGTEYKDTDVENGVTYYYTVRAVDTGGNEDGNKNQASATAETQPPETALEINNGAEYTNTATVTLTVNAPDAYQCRFANDNMDSWGSWESYSPQKTWTLSSGDGKKTVYVQCKDSIGNTAPPASAAIYLDTESPVVSILEPQDGASVSTDFTLKIRVTDNLFSTVICTGSIDGNEIEIGAINTAQEVSHAITTSQGSHTIVVSCNDGVNTASQQVSISANAKPYVSIIIGSGTGYVATRTVTLSVTASNAVQCQFSNDGVQWSSWYTYSPQQPWTLTPGDGTKTVYAQCRDSSGTLSDVAQDTVILSSSGGPGISISINNGAQYVNSIQVTLGLYALGASQCHYSNNGQTWTSWSPYTTSLVWQLDPGDGPKTVYYECVNAQGKSIGIASASTYLISTPPSPPSSLDLEINNDDEYTNSRDVELTIHAKYANECRFSNDDGDWTDWQPYTTSMDWRLSSGDGSKRVDMQCRNDYGTSKDYATIYLDTTPPTRVTGLTGQAIENSVQLTWNPSTDTGSGLDYYIIYRSSAGGGHLSKIGISKTEHYVDNSVQSGKTYTYQVTAVDNAGNEGSGDSIQVTVGGGGEITVTMVYPKDGSEVKDVDTNIQASVKAPDWEDVKCIYVINDSSPSQQYTCPAVGICSMPVHFDVPMGQVLNFKAYVACEDGNAYGKTDTVYFKVYGPSLPLGPGPEIPPHGE